MLKSAEQCKIDFFQILEENNQNEKKQEQTFSDNLKTLKAQINDFIENPQKKLSSEIENLIFPLLKDDNSNDKIIALKELQKMLAKIKI